MLYLLTVVLLLLWLAGWAYGIGGAYIHLLLISALIVLTLALLGDKNLPDWPMGGDE